eukprot:jgi/Hompol1/3382/HPOL_006497-RA
MFKLALLLIDLNTISYVFALTNLTGAMVAVRTNQEIKDEILTPLLAQRMRLCTDSTSECLDRAWKTGALFDLDRVYKNITDFATKGEMTFLEAYRRTGRIFNVTVVSDEPHAEPKLLNYITAPDVIIASAVMASSAIPGVLPPVQLIHKTPQGIIKPFRAAGNHWRDGSLQLDIPQHDQHQLFNVNYTVVSQVNPHIALFFFNSRGTAGCPNLHRKGHGWRGGFVASSIIQYLLLDLQKWLSFIRDMDLLPRIMGVNLSNLWLQKFQGTVTIIPPRPRFTDYFGLLSDPSEAKLQRLLDEGSLVTFPKLQMVSNRWRVERIIERVTRETRVLCVRDMDKDTKPEHLLGSDSLSVSPAFKRSLRRASMSSLTTAKLTNRTDTGNELLDSSSVRLKGVTDYLETVGALAVKHSEPSVNLTETISSDLD